MTNRMTTDTDSPEKKIAAASPLFPQQDIDEIQRAISNILLSGRLILGEHTLAFEQEFQSYLGVEYAVAVSTCTAAIQIALRFYQVKQREVILPTNNFIGVVSAVLAEGATPILTDMNTETFCADTDDVLARITPKTAGIILVHIAGLVHPDIDHIRRVCEDKGIFLLEDASHAHGAEIDGRKAGSLADVGCFSFYPTKLMTTGSGGMLTTRNKQLADYARSVRHHGVGNSLDDVVNLGNDWCMSEIHAVLGRFQLKRLEQNLEHRNRLISRYKNGLKEVSWLSIPRYPKNFRHAYYKLPILLREGLDRDRFRRMIFEDYHIENGAIYDPPCHLQPVLRDLLGYSEGMYPKAESALKRQFCPPIHSALTEQQIDRVIAAIIEAGRRCGFD